ncbi:MAG: hypothetical protein SXQ77_13680 [Halobacteria archaeon]|nr:hypothetical protein [Halobacteria archaeon]
MRLRKPAWTYRRVDRLSKIAGLLLVAGALEVGYSTTGIALGTVGVIVGVATVFSSRGDNE